MNISWRHSSRSRPIEGLGNKRLTGVRDSSALDSLLLVSAVGQIIKHDSNLWRTTVDSHLRNYSVWPPFAIDGWRSIVDTSLIFYYSLPQNKSMRPPNNLPYLESVSQERSSNLRIQNPMILAAIFSPHKPRFNEVAVHEYVSAVCCWVWSKFKCRWQLQSFTCKWTCQDIFIHYVAFFYDGVTSQSLRWRPTSEGYSRQCRFSHPTVQFEADCGSHFTCSSSHRRSLKSSRSSVRCYLGKDKTSGEVLDFKFLATTWLRIFFIPLYQTESKVFKVLKKPPHVHNNV